MKPLFAIAVAAGLVGAALKPDPAPSCCAEPAPAGPVPDPKPRPHQCMPYAEVCTACKDCSACAHCSVKGGKCSVCWKR